MNTLNTKGALNLIEEKIRSKLDEIGLLYRMFYRVKDSSSLEHKISSDPKYGISKKIQDLIGIRVVLYFKDDIEIARAIISSCYIEREKDVSIDEASKSEFKAIRYNIVYSLDDETCEVLNLPEGHKTIDSTFELQIRTVFSEGWHEVEHDLRYKCSSDWVGFDTQYRVLNGLYAGLEGCEWTMLKVFDDLAYGHYKAQNWEAMIRQKFRLRFGNSNLSQDIRAVFDNNAGLGKNLYRLDRKELLQTMSDRGYYYPINLDNIVFFANMAFINNNDILNITPKSMIADMDFEES